MKTIIKELKTLPKSALTNSMSPFQATVFVLTLITLLAGGMYLADPTSLQPFK